MTKIALVTLVLCLGVLTAASVGAQAPPPAAPPQIPYGAPITLEQAKKAAAGAEAESRKNNWNMAIVILDTGGNLVLLHRMDQTQIASIEIARQKAWSAVAYRRPTKVFEDGLAQGGLNTRILKLEGAVPVEGGLPIIVDGKVIGAIGASGGTSGQDGQVAKAGLDGMK